jgi:PAS domain S-box-containing protein
MQSLEKKYDDGFSLKDIKLIDLYDINELQTLQDIFADTTGVASIITDINGVPITKPSNFCRLCNDIIRKTEKGLANCFKSDAFLGKQNEQGPIVQPCLSGGLWDAGASITVGGKHIANWLIGQVRNEEISEDRIINYATEIGADKDECLKAFHEVNGMSIEQFQKVANMLFAFAKEFSDKAYKNLLLIRQIKEKEETEKALIASEERFRRLFEDSADPILILNEDGFVDCNQSAVEILEYQTKDDLLSKQPWEISPEFQYDGIKSIDKVKDVVKVALNQGYNKFDWLHKKSNGDLIQVEVMLTAIILNGKQSYYTIWRDLSEQRKTEKDLLTAHQKLDLHISQTPLGVIEWDLDFRVKKWNPAAETIFGYTKEEAINQHASFIVTEEVKPLIDDVFNDLLQKKGGTRSTNENVTKNGGNLICEWFNTPLTDPYGNVVGVASLVHDITQRIKYEQELISSEHKLSTLFDSMTEMVALHELVFDENDKPINYIITDTNKAFTDITGIKSENSHGKLANEVYGTEYAPYLEEFSTVALTGIPYNYTTYFQPMDKHFSISVVCTGKNKFATVTTDITAVKQIQDMISAKNKELENYLYVASHDLRSPLVNIQGFSLRLAKKVGLIKTSVENTSLDFESKKAIIGIIDEEIPKTLDFIFTNVAKMDNLINGLLQISRTGRLSMTLKEVKMNKFFESVINAKKYQLSEISATVNVQELDNCFGDENLLNQLFSNLLANAINYRDPNRPLIIEISSKSIYNKVIYSIKDNGIGIAERHLDRIWDVFFRVDSTGGVAGEGLGLSIVKRLTDKHKGKISVNSQLGVGSTFMVELNRNEFSE